jgi:hypothetical protein
MPEIPATWEAEISRSQMEATLRKKFARPYLSTSPMWWYMPVSPAAQKVKVGAWCSGLAWEKVQGPF